ncbi:MAG: DUF177 domain-containing protein [Ignavibacteriales bacterium]|nr:MAG: DUF177 domain-containing protein [Ignavibacteriales bacterium]
MIIKFSNFADGVHQLEFQEKTEKIGLKQPFFDDLFLAVDMDKSHSQIVIKGNLSVKAKYICDRCDDEFVEELKNNFQITYFFTNQYTQKNEDVNLYYLSPEKDKIDLTNDVRDFALLAEPMKKLCKPDCKGLCYKCGANLNVEECNCEK